MEDLLIALPIDRAIGGSRDPLTTRKSERGRKADIKNESSFVDDLGADSLDTVELVMALEEEFECEIPDDEAEKITNVQQAIDYVLNHKK